MIDKELGLRIVEAIARQQMMRDGVKAIAPHVQSLQGIFTKIDEEAAFTQAVLNDILALMAKQEADKETR